MKIVSWILAVVFLAAMLGPSAAGMLSDTDRRALKRFPDPERAYVMMTTENLISEHIQKIMADPENKKDGYLWARKYIAQSYRLLSEDANDLMLYELSDMYKSMFDIVVAHIRGDLKTKDFRRREAVILQDKRIFFQKKFDAIQPNYSTDTALLNQFSRRLFVLINAYAVNSSPD
ncbi:hypothetical protein G6K96_21480 [Agrobacterium vitis]|uniref:hypothetical protein n=1 Tax=Agrobacterium vitis TaxID=373 RepID=UPI0015742D2F|nr:hypothetical protein [Agrobacterium vitis]NTA34306.1 hypothetical protein [Agrobacterium vitis]